MTSLIHIQGTAADPALRAQRILRDRGDELLANLAAKVALATDLQLPLGRREELRDRLIVFCNTRLVRHRLAVDQVLYSCAAGAAETRLLVRALRVQHDLVAARITELRRADSSDEFAASAHALVSCSRSARRSSRRYCFLSWRCCPEWISRRWSTTSTPCSPVVC